MVPYINKFNLILILHILFTLTSARKNNLGRVFGGEEAKPRKGPFKYYVSKEVGGWGGQLLTFADKVGGWGCPNADMSKKSEKKSFLCVLSFIY